MEEDKVTLQQALEAETKVRDFIESQGGDVAEVMSRPNFVKSLPDDLRNEWESTRSFWKRMEEQEMHP